MRTARRLLLPLLVLAFSAFPAGAMFQRGQRQSREESTSGSLYRLNFTLHALEGSEDHRRQFVITVGPRRSGRVRAVVKVPMRDGTGTRYVDTGVKCDAEYRETETGIQLEIEMVFSELAPPAAQTSADSPLIYEWQSQVEKAVISGELTVLSSFDDEHANRHYRLEVTAEKLK
jgi:hypothetical protein